ncbi:hypothetical protein [Actinoplanes sp. NPDC051411]|uniref:hypothetical protein n=1 Tax=Actinoplanes sp. NPDC051411 TaxID=3155522 RepID=UPI00343C25A6
MTERKNFKRLVRERARRTGESYTAALRHLRSSDPSEVPSMPWQRIEKTDFGYAVTVPESWVEREPDLNNSPWETARYTDPSSWRHSAIVFRHPSGGRRREAAEMATGAERALTAGGFGELEIAGAEWAGREGVRLDCVKRDAGRVWAVREYFLVVDGVGFCLGLGSAAPDEDEPLFTEMARRFEILEP